MPFTAAARRSIKSNQFTRRFLSVHVTIPVSRKQVAGHGRLQLAEGAAAGRQNRAAAQSQSQWRAGGDSDSWASPASSPNGGALRPAPPPPPPQPQQQQHLQLAEVLAAQGRFTDALAALQGVLASAAAAPLAAAPTPGTAGPPAAAAAAALAAAAAALCLKGRCLAGLGSGPQALAACADARVCWACCAG